MAQGDSDESKLTPMFRQYFRAKREHPDEILFFRMGDFYEMFFDDAKLAARVLGIALTSRSKDPDAAPMAGVPCHSAAGYINRLIKSGYRVAVCEQLEDPASAKGLVERGVVRIITPGTVVEEELLDGARCNYLCALNPAGEAAGLAWVDVSTGSFELAEVESPRVLDEIAALAPSELLVPQSRLERDDEWAGMLKSSLDVPLSGHPDYTFDSETAHATLCAHFGTTTLEAFDCNRLDAAVGSAGAIVDYLRKTHKGTLAQIRGLKRTTASDRVVLDRSTRWSLELVETMRDRDKRGSLLGVLDETRTAMGARLLREWVLRPLRLREPIERRLGAVAELVESVAMREHLSRALSGLADMERISARVAMGSASPRDLVALAKSLGAVPTLREILQEAAGGLLVETREGLDPVRDVANLIEHAIVPDPPATVADGRVIRDGYDAALDELRSIAADGVAWVKRFERDEARRTGIPSLKVGYNRVFGYYIEVTNAHRERVPAEYTRKQTLKNAERYITTELREFQDRLLSADERSRALEAKLYGKVLDRVGAATERLQANAQRLALLDVLACLARVATARGYCKPEIADEPTIEIAGGRHPVLEVAMPSGEFVPNDAMLDGGGRRLLVVTGPNMAGKSTYIRQVALITLMAHVGSFVPATKARIGLVDRIFTRVGASDELARGRSTFMVEMTEAARILNNATPRSLVILDEVGRGTSTYDGVSIAWSICEYLHDRSRSLVLFATHYHELTAMADVLDGVANLNVAVAEWGGKVTFLRRIVPGGTDKSYGLHVARIAGVPEEVVERAGEILHRLESEAPSIDHRGDAGGRRGPVTKPVQLPLFASAPHPLVELVKEINVDETTPLEALKLLEELKRRLERG